MGGSHNYYRKYSIFALCIAAVMGFAIYKDLPAEGVIVCGALALALARKDRVLPSTQRASTAAIPACSAPRSDEAWLGPLSRALNCLIALRSGVIRRIPGGRRFALRRKSFDIHAGRASGDRHRAEVSPCPTSSL
jgi:hypothetical protein